MTTKVQQSRWILPVLAAALLCAGPRNAGGQQAPAAAQSPVDRATSLADALDAFETGTAGGAVPDFDAVGPVYRALDEYVAANADDVRGLIVLARLNVIARIDAAAEGSDGPTAQQAIDALQHVLELEPGNAEAHHWLARTYTFDVPDLTDGVFTPLPLDLERAIGHGRQAVERAPANVAYREALAGYLAMAERFEEAIAVFDDSPAPMHIVRRILEDLESVPRPAGARYLPTESLGLADTMARRGRFADYFQLRTRIYVVAGTRALFEDALRERWPEFEFYEAEREDGDASETLLAQVLEERDGALQPMSVADVARSAGADPLGLVLVGVLEMLNPPDEARERFGVPNAESIALLTLASVRKAEPELVALTALGERLVGEWRIEAWSYRGARGDENYTGTLTITTQTSDSELEGELFARAENGNWARQRMLITVEGDRLALRGEIITLGGPWEPDNLSLRLEGDRLTGNSVDRTGAGGRVVFARQ